MEYIKTKIDVFNYYPNDLINSYKHYRGKLLCQQRIFLFVPIIKIMTIIV